jgi:hypothetical protein
MSLWLIPMIYAAASFLGGITLPRLEQAYLPYDSGISVASAQAFFAAVASGMIALTGIVFTVGLVMVQFSAIAYSPRLVLLLSRDPKLFHSLGVSGVALSTVADFEIDKREPRADNLTAMRRALEDAGVEFLPARSGHGVGVRLREG